MITHFMQSKIWENYLKLEKSTTFRLTDKDIDCLVVEKPTPFGSYFFLPYGPALTTVKPDSKNSATITQPQTSAKQSISAAKNSLSKAIASLLSTEQAESAVFIRIEPAFPFSASDIASAAKTALKISKSTKTATKSLKIAKTKDLDPKYTWVLDLDTQTEEELLKNMESRKVRYWRNAEKKGITLRTSKNPEDITILTNFLKNLGEKDNFTPQDENHLKNQLKAGDFATLYIADYTNPETQKTAPIAAALIYDFDGVRYYAHAATDFEHRKFQAGSIILIQMILDAKNTGAKFYDFWGITKSEDKNHPWYHFTQYKKSFGGREVTYAGTYDIILNPVKYRLYNLARRGNRFLRRVIKK